VERDAPVRITQPLAESEQAHSSRQPIAEQPFYSTLPAMHPPEAAFYLR